MAQENEFAEMTLARLIAPRTPGARPLRQMGCQVAGPSGIKSEDARRDDSERVEVFTPPKDDAERRLYEDIETAVREFQQNVDLQLREEGFSE